MWRFISFEGNCGAASILKWDTKIWYPTSWQDPLKLSPRVKGSLDKRRFRSWCCERYSPSQEVFDEGLTSETLTSQWSLYCVYLTLINSSDNEFSDYIKMCLWLLGDTRKNPIADRRTRILRNFKYRTLENKTFEKTLHFVCLTG